MLSFLLNTNDILIRKDMMIWEGKQLGIGELLLHMVKQWHRISNTCHKQRGTIHCYRCVTNR